MTSSLYVPGELVGPGVLVEAGAGYFIEKDNKDATAYCDRKMVALTKSAQEVAKYINSKREMMGKVQ